MSDQKSFRTLFLGGLITFVFGVLTFLLQQHYKNRELDRARDEKLRAEQNAALQNFSKECSNLAGAATRLELESKFYLDNFGTAPAKPAETAMDNFLKQLVALQGVGAAAAPLFNFQYEECAPAPQAQERSLEVSIGRALARARCEVALCIEQRERMSSSLRSR